MPRRHFLSFTSLVVITAMFANAQTPSCAPECYNDLTPYNGHGAASNLPSQICNDCAGDSRRVVVVRIDATWNSAPGQTNANVWNAVSCAVNMWNSARDGAGNRIGYHFVVDQQNLTGVSTADITVTQENLAGGIRAASDPRLNPTSPSRQNTLSLTPVNGDLGGGSFTASDLCGRVAHELGHLIGINEVGGDCNTIMSGSDADGTRGVDTVQPVDVAQVNRNFDNSTRLQCTSWTFDSNEEEGITRCSSEQALDCINSLGIWREETCYCDHSIGPHTPILIDVAGDGFRLTNAVNGVNFDLDNDGTAERLAWTAIGSNEMFLVLDRNNNGTIDNGTELFGDLTPQADPPAGQQRNGFLALAEFDKPANGGDGNQLITPSDAIFESLRLWQDVNHNGISEATELFRLEAAGLKTIEVDYKLSKKADEFGNQFRYRSKVTDAHDAQLGRWAWDIILLPQP